MTLHRMSLCLLECKMSTPSPEVDIRSCTGINLTSETSNSVLLQLWWTNWHGHSFNIFQSCILPDRRPMTHPWTRSRCLFSCCLLNCSCLLLKVLHLRGPLAWMINLHVHNRMKNFYSPVLLVQLWTYGSYNQLLLRWFGQRSASYIFKTSSPLCLHAMVSLFFGCLIVCCPSVFWSTSMIYFVILLSRLTPKGWKMLKTLILYLVTLAWRNKPLQKPDLFAVASLLFDFFLSWLSSLFSLSLHISVLFSTPVSFPPYFEPVFYQTAAVLFVGSKKCTHGSTMTWPHSCLHVVQSKRLYYNFVSTNINTHTHLNNLEPAKWMMCANLYIELCPFLLSHNFQSPALFAKLIQAFYFSFPFLLLTMAENICNQERDKKSPSHSWKQCYTNPLPCHTRNPPRMAFCFAFPTWQTQM